MVCSAVVVRAQQASPALEQILSRVEANTDQYEASVPNFFCDEHITSLLVIVVVLSLTVLLSLGFQKTASDT